jgi:acyl carrier protein
MTNSTPAASIDLDAIKEIVAEQIGVALDAHTLDADRDLYAAGLTSLATVGLMLALEERFDVEFPESMLSRGTFRSVATIAEAVAKLAR